jgi:uncharacterized damage-inducible protein DinB
MEEHVTAMEPAAGDAPLVALFRHNLWANLALLDFCAALDETQLAGMTVGTFGTIYDTVNHIARAEEWYLFLFTGRWPENRLRKDDRPDFDVLLSHARQSGEGLIAIAATATAGDVVVIEEGGGRWPYTAGMILNQAINHATEHRAQVMTMLTQQGIEPPELSGWAYADPRVTPLAD